MVSGYLRFYSPRKKIKTAISTFSRTGCRMVLNYMFCSVVLNRKRIHGVSKHNATAAKPEVIISQYAGELEKQFQPENPHFPRRTDQFKGIDANVLRCRLAPETEIRRPQNRKEIFDGFRIAQFNYKSPWIGVQNLSISVTVVELLLFLDRACQKTVLQPPYFYFRYMATS